MPVSSRCFWSPPAQNALSPAPVNATTPTDESAHAALKQRISSSTVRLREELKRSGRLVVL